MAILTVTGFESWAVDDAGGSGSWDGGDSFIGNAAMQVGPPAQSTAGVQVTAVIQASDIADLPAYAIIDLLTITCTHALSVGTFHDVSFVSVPQGTVWDDTRTSDHAGAHETAVSVSPPTIAALAALAIGHAAFGLANSSSLKTAGNTVSAFDVSVTYHELPYAVDPSSGGILGADPVTITGAGFDDGVTGVTFGGSAATDVVVIDDTTLTCVTPAHAEGLVDVVLTRGDATTKTLPDAFTFDVLTTTCIVDAGQAQVAVGPLPSTITTAAVVTRGKNNGALTYLWTLLSGPATPTISDPTALETDVVFDTFVEGAYVVQLAVTTQGAVFTATDGLTILMGPTVPPRVTSGRQQLVWA